MNELSKAISQKREDENFTDTADIIEQCFDDRVEQIGKDAACIELVESDAFEKSPIALALIALRRYILAKKPA